MLAVLNIGQAPSIVAIGLTLLLWRASVGVVAGTLTLGDLVLINAFLIDFTLRSIFSAWCIARSSSPLPISSACRRC